MVRYHLIFIFRGDGGRNKTNEGKDRPPSPPLDDPRAIHPSGPWHDMRRRVGIDDIVLDDRRRMR
jgi:hypothetical protein